MARLRDDDDAGPGDDEYGRERYGHLETTDAVFPWQGLRWEPVRIGPTWQTTAEGRWLLPDITIGWHVLGWSDRWLHAPGGGRWHYTDEQARFLLWWYALTEDARFLYRAGVLQRLKGWGKDPLGACLCLVEAFGPCRFSDWGKGGQPQATYVPDAWVQTAAVALDQTKNTTRLFPILAGPAHPASAFRRQFGLQIGKTLIHGMGDTRLIQAVTSSPDTLQGARSTFVLPNETHEWDDSNEGHDMAAVIDDNATKTRARTLKITNAYEPSGDSVAQRDREAYEKMAAGQAADIGLLYDSLEAPPEAPLSEDAAPEVVAAIRGDSAWLDVKQIVARILDIRNPPSRARRFWYNQVTAAEDAWVTQQQVDALAAAEYVVPVEDVITLGFDGSKSNDHTALIGCHVDSDHLFELGIWAPDKRTGVVDRAAVNRAVEAAFQMYDVVGFYADVAEFESYIDKWAGEFGDDLVVSATGRQPIAWDMRNRQKQFTSAAERLYDAIASSADKATKASETGADPGERLTYDGSKMFRLHLINARRSPNDWGVSVRKESRESSRKIDAVPASVLARLARQDYLALPPTRRRKKRTGQVW